MHKLWRLQASSIHLSILLGYLNSFVQMGNKIPLMGSGYYAFSMKYATYMGHFHLVNIQAL
jgi:hypothetical protein